MKMMGLQRDAGWSGAGAGAAKRARRLLPHRPPRLLLRLLHGRHDGLRPLLLINPPSPTLTYPRIHSHSICDQITSFN